MNIITKHTFIQKVQLFLGSNDNCLSSSNGTITTGYLSSTAITTRIPYEKRIISQHSPQLLFPLEKLFLHIHYSISH